MIGDVDPSDFPTVLDAAPPVFGIFYIPPSADPLSVKFSAVIRTIKGGFSYSLNGPSKVVLTTEYETKGELIARMTADNQLHNAGMTCVVEF